MGKRKSEIEGNTPKKIKPHWAMGLMDAMKDPKNIVKSDDLVTVIKDAYPKAEFHYLVIPKEDISNLKALNKDHVELLKHIENIAQEVASLEEHKNKIFKFGYHAEPSMAHLHLHVISDDMNSSCVKTKKHWNSFNTPFFLNPQDVRESLETDGKVSLPTPQQCKDYINTPLHCHKCKYEPKHMPDLKKHILTHL
ncbi:unnamed protein product [Phyllotreta striolata]|uniref:HIT domain-containing protein n=1 Tax=Phyllotreta striolata TaxID=444603 RepID=A0A9N9TNV7_PHYSR|nr:unnamed protein product [Phyllotreta striolata]